MENLSSNNYKLWKSMENHGFFRQNRKTMKMAPVCRWFADSKILKGTSQQQFGAPAHQRAHQSLDFGLMEKSFRESFEAHGPSGIPWQQNIPCKVDEWKFVERNRKLRAASSFVFPIGGILVWNFLEQDFLLDFRLCQVSVPKNHPWFGQAPLFWGGRMNPNNQDD